MPEAMYICPNCQHKCTESQAMLTQGVCKPCQVAKKGEFYLDDAPAEEQPAQEREALPDCGQVAQDIIALCREKAPDSHVLSLIGLSRFLEVIAYFVKKHDASSRTSFRGLDVVFHGTDAEHLPIIKESGLITPDGVYHQAKHGQVLGKGVYASASWHFANQYGKAVLVCLAMPGVRTGGRLTKELDIKQGQLSSWAPDERIVYSYEGQVLPLIVVKNHQDATSQTVKDLMMQAKQMVETTFGVSSPDTKSLFFPNIWSRQ
mmetsp:Transcript_26682/g.40483  ORF Transcript_26682/g.40483 Transcript_26682/m.40483 type:complete len:261 (-) Transcript_26682:210-992(-)